MRHSKHIMLAVLAIVVLFCATGVFAQVRQEVRIPDVMGYKTLKCDLHMHTVFSDGNVWPTVRVEEAWREGLDVIAITDHIEYQPHKDDIPTNFNRSYEIAAPVAKDRGILLIRAAEITRDTPPGHFNALFLKDINPLNTKELLDCMAEADKQGAFIWWNHPDWKPEHKGWFDIHTTLYEKEVHAGHRGRQRRRLLPQRAPMGDRQEPDVHGQHGHPCPVAAGEVDRGEASPDDAGLSPRARRRRR